MMRTMIVTPEQLQEGYLFRESIPDGPATVTRMRYTVVSCLSNGNYIVERPDYKGPSYPWKGMQDDIGELPVSGEFRVDEDGDPYDIPF